MRTCIGEIISSPSTILTNVVVVYEDGSRQPLHIPDDGSPVIVPPGSRLIQATAKAKWHLDIGEE